jgi:cell division protein ZapA
VSAVQVTVKIYGESYPLRTDEPAARLEELARYVDARMREVAASGKVVTTSKIAVLAALHIAEELFRLRGAPPAAPPAVAEGLEERLFDLARILDRALAPGADDGSGAPESGLAFPPVEHYTK